LIGTLQTRVCYLLRICFNYYRPEFARGRFSPGCVSELLAVGIFTVSSGGPRSHHVLSCLLLEFGCGLWIVFSVAVGYAVSSQRMQC
jgi:hypothetical protein